LWLASVASRQDAPNFGSGIQIEITAINKSEREANPCIGAFVRRKDDDTAIPGRKGIGRAASIEFDPARLGNSSYTVFLPAVQKFDDHDFLYLHLADLPTTVHYHISVNASCVTPFNRIEKVSLNGQDGITLSENCPVVRFPLKLLNESETISILKFEEVKLE